MRSVLLSFIILIVSITAQSKDNPFYIDSLHFDRELHRFELEWHADSLQTAAGLEYGITVSCSRQNNDPPFAHAILTKLTSDTMFTLSELVYDTVYSVGLWAYNNGVWYKPDSISSKNVYVSSVSRQPISIFRPAKVNDTVRALCNSVVLWKDSTYSLGIPEHKDTVIAYMPPDSVLKGFIRLSKGIRFANPEPALPFNIAIAIDSVPAKCKLQQIHIYRDSAGLFIPEDSSFFDSAKSQFVLKTADLRLPLIILADTAKPLISLLSVSKKIIGSATLYDTLNISDNSANVKWSFSCEQGLELLNKTKLTGYIKGSSGRVICQLSPVGAQINGIRASLICSDGANADTFDLSKCGIRLNSDPVTIPLNMITPVSTTVKLDSMGVRQCLKSLFSRTGGLYDQSIFRIYRWLPDISNAASPNKWIEYNSQNESKMSLIPGMMLWVISDKTQTIDMGTGTTLSFKDTVSIEAGAKNWTDFINPYGFNLRISDLIRLSGAAQNELTIYKWVEDREKRTFKTSLVYSNAVSGANSLHDTLYAMHSGYTVYNSKDVPVNLRFAPLTYNTNEPAGLLLKKTKIDRLSIKIRAGMRGQEFGEVYCGVHRNSDKTISSPLPPSFGSSSLMIKDRAGNDSCGILFRPFSENEPAVFDVDIKGDGGEAEISADIIENDIGAQFAFFKKGENGYDAITDGRISLQKNSGSVVLVAGTSSQVASFLDNNSKMLNVSANVIVKPSRGMLQLEFKNIEKGICCFEMFTLDGSRVLAQRFEHSPGKLKYIPVNFSSGVYVIKVKITKDNSVIYSMAREFSLFYGVK